MSKKNPRNRLREQKSLYLLQHADNPVDWYPWGDEAIKAAKAQDKPIFLSIGYSTCHWCHVMEKESFNNPELARELNDTFIPVKVDREELPEIDNLYMEFAQSMMPGAAGWPLNVILTPDLKPFFATTYIPPRSERGELGLKELIYRIRDVWNGPEREKVQVQAEKVVDVFADSVHVIGDNLPPKELLEEGVDVLYKLADPVFGGMKGVPKFPLGYQINFYLRWADLKQDSRALFLAEKSLEMMHRGGIWDHLGGGFSRYSTDAEWIVPHFEKMLYDNALLLDAYLEGWLATENPEWKRVVEQLGDFLINEMSFKGGPFYSAIDADSEGEEGGYYTWTMEEIRTLLGSKQSRLFCKVFGVLPKGNFEGKNVLYQRLLPKVLAEEKGMELSVLEEELEASRKILLEARNKRAKPFVDDKVLSSWNGLMIHALARAGTVLKRKDWLEKASLTATFIRDKMVVNGVLLRRFRDGDADFPGGLEEYAFTIKGLITLFEMGLGREWLELALQLTTYLGDRFKEERGAFYQTDGADPYLILRRCHFSDGAEPSGNAIHCENLLRLYAITGVKEYLEGAEDILSAAGVMMEAYTPGYLYHQLNLLRYFDAKRESLVIVFNPQQEGKEEIRNKIFSKYSPHQTLVWIEEKDLPFFSKFPATQQKRAERGKTTVYPCFDGVCKRPLVGLDEIL